MEKKLVQGSCHCGKIKFEAKIDFSKPTTRCNCTYCQKTRYWGVHIPPQDFTLIKGEEALRSYSRTRRDQPFELKRQMSVYENDLAFCGTCGVHAFNIGNIPEIGGDYVSISVGCLDDIDFASVMKVPVVYMDGRNDDWFSTPAFTGHL